MRRTRSVASVRETLNFPWPDGSTVWWFGRNRWTTEARTAVIDLLRASAERCAVSLTANGIDGFRRPTSNWSRSGRSARYGTPPAARVASYAASGRGWCASRTCESNRYSLATRAAPGRSSRTNSASSAARTGRPRRCVRPHVLARDPQLRCHS